MIYLYVSLISALIIIQVTKNRENINSMASAQNTSKSTAALKLQRNSKNHIKMNEIIMKTFLYMVSNLNIFKFIQNFSVKCLQIVKD